MLRAWKDLSPRERLRFAYLPLGVAVVAAVGVILVNKGASSLGSHGPSLHVVDVVIANARTENDHGKPHIEVTLHNTGDRRAILTRLRTRVIRSAFFPACLLFGGEGIYETGRYSVLLPKQPPPGFLREHVLNEQAGPDEVDRFRTTFETEGTELGTAALYELSLAIEASDERPIPLGRFLAMTPFSLSSWNWTSFFASSAGRLRLEHEGTGGPVYVPRLGKLSPASCYRRNEELVAPFLASPARHSAALGRLLKHIENLGV